MWRSQTTNVSPYITNSAVFVFHFFPLKLARQGVINRVISQLYYISVDCQDKNGITVLNFYFIKTGTRCIGLDALCGYSTTTRTATNRHELINFRIRGIS